MHWFIGSLLLIAIFFYASVSKLHEFPAPIEMSIILKSKGGMEVHVLRTGAVVQRLIVPDASGNTADVVLGFDDEEPYQNGTSPYFGAVVGRVANRIANAEFTLDGNTYTLAANNGPNCLHGGVIGFSRLQWTVADQGTGDDHQFVKLTCFSPNGDEVRTINPKCYL